MKVPYLKKKIDAEFETYLSEFATHATSAAARAQGEPEFFRLVYPLFVLLRGLVNSSYMRDPARDTILSELRRQGRKRDFVEVVSQSNSRGEYREELLTGLQRQTFTAYFDELFSDALLLLNSYYSFNYRGTLIALRCMLEDLYRHLFYRDHPQEFWALGRESDWDEFSLGITPQRLRGALRSSQYADVFVSLDLDFKKKKKKEDMDIFGLNDKLYASCSSALHGASESKLSGLKSNLDLEPNPIRSGEVVGLVRSFVDMAVSFLIAAHLDHFLAFSEYERSMVLAAFSPARRASFRRALNV